jgi:hypothetical protein
LSYLKKNKDLCILYLAGYGRSGTTLIESILGSHHNVLALGELYKLNEVIDNSDYLCSCGKQFVHCNFWAPIVRRLDCTQINHLAIQKARNTVECNRISVNALHTFKLKGKSSELNKYEESMTLLFNTIWDYVPNDVQYIIDSSKTAYSCARRPITLNKICKLNVKVLHIVRDFKGVMNSIMKKGLNRNLQIGVHRKTKFARLRSVLGWISANEAAERLQRYLPKGNYLRIKYEDFISFPASSLNTIGNFLSIDFSHVSRLLSAGMLESNSHQVAGNRMRYKRKIFLNADPLKTPQGINNLLLSALSFFQERKYGYHR